MWKRFAKLVGPVGDMYAGKRLMIGRDAAGNTYWEAAATSVGTTRDVAFLCVCVCFCNSFLQRWEDTAQRRHERADAGGCDRVFAPAHPGRVELVAEPSAAKRAHARRMIAKWCGLTDGFKRKSRPAMPGDNRFKSRSSSCKTNRSVWTIYALFFLTLIFLLFQASQQLEIQESNQRKTDQIVWHSHCV